MKRFLIPLLIATFIAGLTIATTPDPAEAGGINDTAFLRGGSAIASGGEALTVYEIAEGDSEGRQNSTAGGLGVGFGFIHAVYNCNAIYDGCSGKQFAGDVAVQSIVRGFTFYEVVKFGENSPWVFGAGVLGDLVAQGISHFAIYKQ